MAYKLDLPPSSHVHPVFYVSHLNKVIDVKILVQTILLETILKTRVKQL
jgi:hypothetical protein